MKLADFGFAKEIDDMEEGIKRTLLGTPLYAPMYLCIFVYHFREIL